MNLHDSLSLLFLAFAIGMLIYLIKDHFFTPPPTVRREIQATCSQGEYGPLVSFLADQLNDDDQWTVYHTPSYSRAIHRYYGISVHLEEETMQVNIGSVGGSSINLLSDNNLLMTADEKKTLALPAMNLLLYSQSRLINDISCDFPLDPYTQDEETV